MSTGLSNDALSDLEELSVISESYFRFDLQPFIEMT